MPLQLDIKRQLLQRTDRVKGVDLHPTEPWLLANLYNGNVYIWNHQDSTLVKSFEINELPVRTAKFVARKQWIVTGSDDMYIRVFNYNTMDKVKAFEAHTDYVRCVAVHPNLPYILTSSDDMLIKLWDWDKGWSCTQVFEGHSHYVMQVAINPKDTNTFASASLDRTIKVWSIGQPTPNFTLEGHEKGVNCIDYFHGGDRPYLVSGADDRLVKVWDYQTKACVQTLEGHTHNVAAVAFHPELPIIVTGGEDGTVKLWHSTTYRLESTLDYRLERVWSIGCVKGSNLLAIGCDEGATVLKIGNEEPVASMDSGGKIVWAHHNEVQTVNVKALGAEYALTDGERLPLPVKDLGSSDLYPQSLAHSPNGRFVVVCGDGEYVVYTALAWRNKAFGAGLDFAWGSDSNDFAVRETSTKVKIFKNFVERFALKVDYTSDGLFGGSLVAVRHPDYLVFYDWEGRIVRRVDVAARTVRWSESGDQVAIVGDSSFFVLKFNRDALEEYYASGEPLEEEGCEEAFELQNEVAEKVGTCVWVGDCFIYTNDAWRLCYAVGGEVSVLSHLDRPMYLLGYLASMGRIFLVDREFNVVCFTLLLSLIEFKTLISRGDVASALALVPSVPADAHTQLAKFLEAKGFLREALKVATDDEHRFDLAIQMEDLSTAQDVARRLDNRARWRQLGELTLATGHLDIARTSLSQADDLPSLLLLAASSGDRSGLEELAARARAQGKHNIAFASLFLLADVTQCVDLLLEAERLPEAAFFARTYAPSRMSACVVQWRSDLAKTNPKAAEALADPAEFPNLFPGLAEALQAEEEAAALVKAALPAAAYGKSIGLNEGGGEDEDEDEEETLEDALEEERGDGALEEEGSESEATAVPRGAAASAAPVPGSSPRAAARQTFPAASHAAGGAEEEEEEDVLTALGKLSVAAPTAVAGVSPAEDEVTPDDELFPDEGALNEDLHEVLSDDDNWNLDTDE